MGRNTHQVTDANSVRFSLYMQGFTGFIAVLDVRVLVSRARSVLTLSSPSVRMFTWSLQGAVRSKTFQ